PPATRSMRRPWFSFSGVSGSGPSNRLEGRDSRIKGYSGAEGDIGWRRETAKPVLIHCSEKRDPHDASVGVFEPDGAIDDPGEEFVIRSSILSSRHQRGRELGPSPIPAQLQPRRSGGVRR